MRVCSRHLHNIKNRPPVSQKSPEKGYIMNKTNQELFFDAIGRPGFESWISTGSSDRIEVHTRDESHHFGELSLAEQRKVLHWIRANVVPRKTPLNGHTSYGMKHVLEHRTNIYVTNNQFKEAMLLCGYYPVCVDELNWRYCISKRSPIFTLQKDRRCGLEIPSCVMEYPHAEWEFEHGVWQCSNCGEEGASDSSLYDPDLKPKLRQCYSCGAIIGEPKAQFPIKKI